MRLHRMTLRNFGGVVEKSIDFGPNVTVVAGPNEIGKSSFQAAMRLLFHYLDNSTATQVRSFVPTDQGSIGPEVELEAEAGRYQFVYRKRWRYKPKTELVIRAPKPENLSGRDAHNRARAILEEEADYALFEALQLMQGAPLAQANLERGASLSQALDKAAGGSDPTAENDSLYEAVTMAYERYWTLKTGRETGELAKAREAGEAAAAVLYGVEGQLADLADYVEAVASGKRDLKRKDELLVQLRQRLDERQAEIEAVDKLEREVADLRAAEATASLVLTRGENAQAERQRTLRSEAEARARVEEIKEQLAPAQQSVTALQAAADRTKGAYDGAKQTYNKAAQARSTAERVVDYLKARTAHAALENKIDQIETLSRERTQAAAESERIRVDDVRLKALQDAENVLRVATSTLEVQAPRIALDARQAVTLATAEGEERVAAGDRLEKPVTAPLTIDVTDVLSLRIDPGATLADRQAARGAAAEALAALCDDLGVKDLSEGQDKHRRRGELLQDLKSTDAEIRILLDGKRLQDLAEARARHAATLQAMDGLERSVSETLEEAEAVLRDTRDKAAAAEEARDQCREAFDQAERAAFGAEQHARGLATQLAGAKEALARAEKALENAREQASDEKLGANLQQAATAHAEAEAALGDGQSRLAALSPEAARVGLQSAQDAFVRATQEHGGLRDALNKARGQLSHLRDEGLQEKRDKAKAEYDQAARELASVERRANAAKRLYQTLTTHREAARRKYLTPFQERVEALVRLVQGTDVLITLDDDLSVQSRTIGDTTVPFDWLSGGAKEQIGLACRLAAAMLVADRGGVPVLLDDTLGYSDPDRLPKLGAMIDHAGRSVQIIIFTCQPDRFADVGAANVVHLGR